MDEQKLDLTTNSFTFPDFEIESEILADSKIREIKRKFSSDIQRIIVVGALGSGKTTLLKQFVQMNKENSFSYFFSENYWNLRPSTFISSLCRQMKKYLNIDTDDEGLTEGRLDIDKNRQIFEGLVQRVVELNKKTNKICYFVVDGIENILQDQKNNELKELIALATVPQRLYFLGSVSSIAEKQITFKFQSIEPNYFSLTESTRYFENFSLTNQQIQKLQDWSGGMPGLLMLAKEMIKSSNAPVDGIIIETQNFEKLLETHWKLVVGKNNGLLENVLCLLSFSITPLTTMVISEIIHAGELEVQKVIEKVEFLKEQGNQEYAFFPDGYKQLARKKFNGFKKSTLESLVRFYRDHNQTKESRLLLPQYLQQTEDYYELNELLTPEYLIDITKQSNDINLAQRNVVSAFDLAVKSEDISALRFCLTSVQLNELALQLFGENEVLALIALKKFDEALEFAYSSKMATTRIRLLSQIYLAMEKSGLLVQRKAIAELTNIVQSLQTDGISPEVLISTAADLFPILPDLAIQLVDSTKRTETTSTPIELFALLTNVVSENPESENLLNRVSNEKIRDYAIAHSAWLSKLTFNEVISKADGLALTKAKEYLLRKWCKQNLNNPQLIIVLEHTLDILAGDPSYHIPLRNLRQLSDCLFYCQSEKIEFLVSRFEVPLFSSLQSPIQEKIRLELNLIECINRFNEEQSYERIKNLYSELCNCQTDTDILCVCLSSLLVSLSRIDKNQKTGLFEIVKEKLEVEFISLIDSSASQLDVTRKVLRSIVIVDIDLAIAFAHLLNSVERRDNGIREVLKAYVALKLDIDYSKKIESSLMKIIDKEIRDQTVSEIIDIIFSNEKHLSEDFLEYLCNLTASIDDPILKCRCHVNILNGDISEEKLIIEYDLLHEALESIDIAWMKIDIGFELVNEIAEKLPKKANELYEYLKNLEGTMSLSHHSIGIMFSDAILKASKLIGLIDDRNEENKKIVDQFNSLIDRIPSHIVKVIAYNNIALSYYRNKRRSDADSIVQEKIIPGLQIGVCSKIKNDVISQSAISLFEYSSEEAIKWVSRLPYLKRNNTWMKIIVRLLTQEYLSEKLDSDSSIKNLNLQLTNQTISILSLIDRDNEIYNAVKILCTGISDPSAKMPEQQKLDSLLKVEQIVKTKLPDKHNIVHDGYLVLALGEIERARWMSAKHLKSTLPKNSKKIIALANGIDNIADRVLVKSELCVILNKAHIEQTDDLLNEAYSEVNNIRNLDDRIDRLEILVDCFEKVNNNPMIYEIIRFGQDIANSLEGLERDKVLSSVIQFAYQYDKNIADLLTEKIENLSTQYEVELSKKASELSKTPQKLPAIITNSMGTEIANKAAEKMNRLISSGKSTTSSRKTLFDWLNSIKNSNYSDCDEVMDWYIDSIIKQSATSEISSVAIRLFQSLLGSAKTILLFGFQISNFSTIPDDLKSNFEGYSVDRKFFNVGQRNEGISFISSWIKENADQSLLICDPYFDINQMWILKETPNDVFIKILCTTKGFYSGKTDKKYQFSNTAIRQELITLREEIKEKINIAWKEASAQTSPRTMFIVYDDLYSNDEFHDRFILSRNRGLSVGTSLNGIGKKSFSITILSEGDVNFIFEKYINPKIRLDEMLPNVIFFELES